MSHPILVKKIEQLKALIVQKDVLFLRENLLTAIAFFVQLLRLVHGACRRSVQHIDQTALRELYESHIVENCARVFVHKEDFLVDAWEELFLAIFAIVFQ